MAFSFSSFSFLSRSSSSAFALAAASASAFSFFSFSFLSRSSSSALARSAASALAFSFSSFSFLSRSSSSAFARAAASALAFSFSSFSFLSLSSSSAFALVAASASALAFSVSFPLLGLFTSSTFALDAALTLSFFSSSLPRFWVLTFISLLRSSRWRARSLSPALPINFAMDTAERSVEEPGIVPLTEPTEAASFAASTSDLASAASVWAFLAKARARIRSFADTLAELKSSSSALCWACHALYSRRRQFSSSSLALDAWLSCTVLS